MSESPNPPYTAGPYAATGEYPPPAPYPVQPADNLRTLAYVVHGLYAASFITGITGIVGLVIAYMKRAEAAGTIFESHFSYAIRTFWIGLAMSFVAFLLCFVAIGFVLLPLVAIWSIVRIVRGFLALSDNRPIANPRGFF